MGRRIEHRGVVESVATGVVMVRTERKTACAECHAKGLCGEQGGERVIKVATAEASAFEPGDKVIVALENTAMAFSAILWAYIFPLCILLAVLFSAHALGFSDGVAALASLGATAIYYVVLYIMRRYFDRKIKFTIIKE
ncbi:MAG: SoxR reducing system RseC family protein [Alistipes sp.]|nr:SoxR reducing system RseC family protein [Alistipes sp.]MBR5130943.1 SoxR reducing system RseC family protein [Alistipes sp.]